MKTHFKRFYIRLINATESIGYSRAAHYMDIMDHPEIANNIRKSQTRSNKVTRRLLRTIG